MLEHVLIVILSILVIILVLSMVIRHRRMRGAILLDEKATNELISAVVENARAGRIPDIADRVSAILCDYLKCSKTAFLKINRSVFELNHATGLGEIKNHQLSIKLTPDLQKVLKTISRVTELAVLEPMLPKESMHALTDFGFNYFFSVFLRNNLFGIYFIKTDLPATNASLKFLTTALAFSLSAAYHIRQQDKRLKKYENRLKYGSNINSLNDDGSTMPKIEFNRYLKIKNSKELVTELTRTLRKECHIDKMAFYVKPIDVDESIIAVNWRIKENIDKSFIKNHDAILKGLAPDRVYNRSDFLEKFPELNDGFRDLSDDEISHLVTVPWINNRRALIAWNGSTAEENMSGYLQDFWRDAMPLVEYINRFEKAEEMSYTDGLTGVYNFRYFQKRLVEEHQRAVRYGRSMALLILDVDDLKTVNDSYGHQAGDLLLKTLARVLGESVRSIDLISRYGGDEFCLIMPETSRNRALLFMDRIRKKIAANPLYIEGASGSQQYSVSIGGAVFPVDADSVEELMRLADRALLQAKAEGRNCSKLFEPEYDKNLSGD